MHMQQVQCSIGARAVGACAADAHAVGARAADATHIDDADLHRVCISPRKNAIEVLEKGEAGAVV